MSVTAAASSSIGGRPPAMTADAFRNWYARWTIALRSAYGASVQVGDYLEHWPASARSFLRYRRRYVSG